MILQDNVVIIFVLNNVSPIVYRPTNVVCLQTTFRTPVRILLLFYVAQKLTLNDNSMFSDSYIIVQSRSQRPRGLRRRSKAAHLLRSWVRIPPGAWIFVCCECRMLSGRGLCDELITRPEESYRLRCVVVCDLETSRTGAPHIYNISSLKVNDLTLILLTWRKW